MLSASIFVIDPNPLTTQKYDELDENIIPSFTVSNSFNTNKDKIEYFVYNNNKELLFQDYDYKQLKVVDNNYFVEPDKDLNYYNFDQGEYNVIYNFITNELSSSIFNTFYIDQISSNRDEIRLKSNFIQFQDLKSEYDLLKNKISNDYFDELYLNFGDNNYFIIINLLLEENSLLIKLYEPLPSQFNEKNEVYIVSKPLESNAYHIKLYPNEIKPNLNKLKGPNINLDLSSINGNISIYKNYNEITSTSLTSSFYKLQNVLNKGVHISTDFTDYSDFIHFSSAKTRLDNFYYKVKTIESYQNDINNLLSNISTTTLQTYEASYSVAYYKQNISDTISKFDEYEHYLYFESNSYAWPKSNTTSPYLLYSTSSAQAIAWYATQSISASTYDNNNQDRLTYLIPEYLRDNPDNDPYLLFIDMVGQLYDNIWIYTNGITKNLIADNRLLEGVSKDLVYDVLSSLGTKVYANNYSIYNIYSSLLGIDPSGSYYPSTGSDLINNYVVVNSGSLSAPYNINDINQEIYKRLYHNIPSILKKKGTIQGIRELINVYGIPNTILRINEFGGNDKNIETGDQWYNLFNYAYTNIGNNTDHIRVPFSVGTFTTRPKTILLRFKAPTFFSASSINYSQSLFRQGRAASEPTAKFSLVLEYTGSTSSGSYSGSIQNPYMHWGTVKFIMSGSGVNPEASVYLPVFDGDWWSVMIRKDEDNIRLFVKNKEYRGVDGNKIGYQASSSLNVVDTASWDIAGDSNILIRLGRTHTAINSKTYDAFSGSLQEFRYYNVPLSESAFNSFVLNPLSIEGNDPSESKQNAYNILQFRAPLGTDIIYTSASLHSLSSQFDIGCFDLKSIHPSITGSNPTQSYPSSFGTGLITSASRYLTPETLSFNVSWSFQPNLEYVLVKQANSGIKSQSTNKIKIADMLYVTASPSGAAVSNLSSIQQYPLFSGSYNKNLNAIEIAFSPQNEIGDDILNQFGNINLGEFMLPSDMSSSLYYYPALRNLSQEYFKKYTHNYYIWDYIRLIKFFDNSLFKLLKDFIPAKTSLLSGLVIKQHLLERNKAPKVFVNISSSLTYFSSSNTAYVLENIYLTGSIKSIPGLIEGKKIYTSSTDYNRYALETSSGGTGGTMPNLTSETYSFNTYITQSWTGIHPNISGNIIFTHSSQDEFFNGEFSGSNLIATTQSLNPNCTVKKANAVDIYYQPYLYSSATFSFDMFLNPLSQPSTGGIYIFYDTGSTLSPEPVGGGG